MTYSCTACGYRSAKWMGFCPQCRLSEGLVQISDRPKRRVSASNGPVPIAKAGGAAVARLAAGIAEIDRVLGGGLFLEP